MAKRARGGGRPGQRRALQRSGPRPASRPSAAPRPTGSSRPAAVPEREVPSTALALDVEVADADAAAEPRPAPSGRARTRGGPSASFAESAAQEYAYVASDVRRIALVGGSLFIVLIVLFVLIEVLGIVHP